MELANPPNPLRPRRQKRRPEMERALLLPEARTGHEADARRFQEAQAVEFIWGLVVLLCGGYGFGAEGYGGEEVHGALLG